MLERTAVGITGHNFHFFVASGALDFEDLDSRDRPAEAVGDRATPWGRHMIESRRPARLIGVHRGVEWHGTFATYFTDVAVPMWLLLVCTTPLLLVAAFELRRVVISTRARRAGLCAHCRTVVASGHARCPECGRAVPSVDVVGQLFLAGGSAADIGHDGRNSG